MSDREELIARFGQAALAASDEGFVALRHPCKESADAFWSLEESRVAEGVGVAVPHWVEERDGAWLHVYDIRDAAKALDERESQSV